VTARSVGDRVDGLLEQLRAGPDPRAATVAEELARCLVQWYGAGLERIADIVGQQQLHELAADPLVESLLLVHDLHPLDVDTRVRRALGAFAGVQHDRVDGDGTAHVRLTGSGHGCRSSVRAAIEAAIQDAAPEVTGVLVGAAPPPLLQISLRPGSRAAR
jgi:hypothetical protein